MNEPLDKGIHLSDSSEQDHQFVVKSKESLIKDSNDFRIIDAIENVATKVDSVFKTLIFKENKSNIGKNGNKVFFCFLSFSLPCFVYILRS